MVTTRYALRVWLAFAFVVCALASMSYLSVQQELRQSGNDPQIQMAYTTGRSLDQGSTPAQVVGESKVDVATELNPITIVFDEHQRVLSTSGTLDGSALVPPEGTFEFTSTHGRDIFTWQPRPGVRLAAVMETYGSVGRVSKYVLVARSLEEVERRESELLTFYGIGLALTLIGLFALIKLVWPSKSS